MFIQRNDTLSPCQYCGKTRDATTKSSCNWCSKNSRLARWGVARS